MRRCWFLLLTILWSLQLVESKGTGFKLVDVSFWSAASSGNMSLQGTIVYPAGPAPAGGFLPAIMIAGSGPNTRWENATAAYLAPQLSGEEEAALVAPYGLCYVSHWRVSPFYDIAVHLAQTANMAVLVWDKRTCLQAPCTYRLCLLPGQTNCLNANRLLESDFYQDSINALTFLRQQQTLVPVARQRAAVLGHSAGCWQVPVVAAHFPGVVQQAVQLMGSAISIYTTLARQYAQMLLDQEAIVQGALCNLSQPDQAGLYRSLQQSIPGLQQTIESIVTQSQLINSGYYDAKGPWAIIDVGGIRAPLLFWQQTTNITNSTTVAHTINAYLAATPAATLLSINSQEDLQVSTYEFYPLRTILASSPFAQRTRHLMFPFRSHFLTPSSNRQGTVAANVLAALSTYFNSPSLSQASPRLRSLALDFSSSPSFSPSSKDEEGEDLLSKYSSSSLEQITFKYDMPKYLDLPLDPEPL